MADSVLCPKCKAPMVLRKSKYGSQFYGCTRFLKGCRGSRNYNPGGVAVVAAAAAHVPMTGTDEQRAFWAECRNGIGHICNSARAGSGKSTSSVEGMWQVDHSLTQGYFAFNTDVVTAFRSKAPPHVASNVQTFHSLGRSILLRAFPGSTLIKEKTLALLDQIYTPSTPEEIDTRPQLEAAIRKLVELCRGCMIEGTPENLNDLATLYDVDLTSEILDKVIQFVPKLLDLHKQQTASHDFADMLWLPIVLNLPSSGLDIVWIDEAQDLNRVKMELALKVINPATGRCIFVGDPYQAINGFTGADVRSMDTFSQLLEERTGKSVTNVSLTYTFRCGSAIVEAVRGIVPDIKTPATKLDGTEWHKGEIINTTTDTVSYAVGDMGVCRCNAPLAGVAYSLIKKGIPCKIKGRDIGGGLIALIRRLRAKSINELSRKLDLWVGKELEKLTNTRNAAMRAQAVQDRADCITALSEDIDGIPELIGRIENLFSLSDNEGNPKGFVVLSSIHKAKGLEADRVVWIQPEIACKCSNADQEQQESNLRYVAGTRARHTLIKAAKPKAA